MAKDNLFSIVGECDVPNLHSGSYFPVMKKEVTLSDAGTYKQGQLVLIDDDMVATLPSATDMSIDGILLDINGKTEAELDGAYESPATVAITGEFNYNGLDWGDIPDTNHEAIIRALLDKNIYIAPMHKAPYVQFGEV